MFKIKLYNNNIKFEHNLNYIDLLKLHFFKVILRMNLIKHIFNMKI